MTEEILCDICEKQCKNNVTECINFDRDCWDCICENKALYNCADCEFEPEDDEDDV